MFKELNICTLSNLAKNSKSSILGEIIFLISRYFPVPLNGKCLQLYVLHLGVIMMQLWFSLRETDPTLRSIVLCLPTTYQRKD